MCTLKKKMQTFPLHRHTCHTLLSGPDTKAIRLHTVKEGSPRDPCGRGGDQGPGLPQAPAEHHRPVHSQLNPCTQRRLRLPHQDASKVDRATYLKVCTFYNATAICTDSRGTHWMM